VIVLGSPCYHGSFSGVLKSALDHLIDEAFKGKSIGVVSHAAGIRVSMQPAQHLALVARTMEGRVSDRLIGTCKADYSEQDGHLVVSSDEILQRSERFVRELLEL
jgi:NAD(P)H-dependent FMN reductase